MTLTADKNQKSTISADTGTINRETKDIQLEGNVKFKADAGNFFGQSRKSSKESKKLGNK
jgi:lipopolysaccharide export system protein LptC